MENVVNETSAQREAERPPMTIQEAIDHALWLRSIPEAVLSTESARRTIETMLSALERSKCYFNAVRRGQEVFVLVQQDRAAPVAIRAWAAAASQHGCHLDKVDQAFRTAEAWQAQGENVTKWPD